MTTLYGHFCFLKSQSCEKLFKKRIPIEFEVLSNKSPLCVRFRLDIRSISLAHFPLFFTERWIVPLFVQRSQQFLGLETSELKGTEMN